MNFSIRVYRMRNSIQHYAWGGKNEKAYIAKFLGIKAESDKPYAELWIGAHPKAPSMIEFNEGWLPLDEAIKLWPTEILGVRVAEKFQRQLPFLLKVLSASEALSIQAHPNKQQAMELHARDPQNYPDDNHKPEIAIALDELTALVGFRAPAQIEQFLDQYEEIRTYVGYGTYDKFRRVVRDGEGRKALRILYEKIVKRSQQERHLLEECLSKLEQRLTQSNSRNETEDYFLILREKYGTDVGLLSVFLLNLVHLAAGEGIFLKAGVPHAYLRGNIVECMANSDNVVRAGLTPKYKDVNTLMNIITYEHGLVSLMQPTAGNVDFTYDAPVEEFRLRRIFLNKELNTKCQSDSVQIILVIKGEAELQFRGGKQHLKAGNSYLIPAAMKSYELQGLNEALLFCAYVP